MNTECQKCLFAKTLAPESEDCTFNIPSLIEKDYEIDIQDGYNYIKDYKCSYAFSKEQYEKHRENLPKDMLGFMREANKLNYYLIVDYSEVPNDEIVKIYNKHIKSLHTLPTKLSLVCYANKDTIKEVIDHLQTHLSTTIDWKIHNLVSEQQDTEKLFDIINTNLINTVHNIWYVHANSIDDMAEDLNYINFLSKVKKPNYPAIRKNDKDLDGLFISASNLRLMKNEHGSDYLKFLQSNNTLVRKYYE